MEEKYTAGEIIQAFSRAWNHMDYYAFVSHIMQATPRDNDAWQEEKWENFQAACAAILRLPVPALERILHYGTIK